MRTARGACHAQGRYVSPAQEDIGAGRLEAARTRPPGDMHNPSRDFRSWKAREDPVGYKKRMKQQYG